MSNLSQNPLVQDDVGSSAAVASQLDDPAAVFALIGNIGCVLCVFHLLGRYIGNVYTTRDSLLLAAFIFLIHWSLFFQATCQILSVPACLYLLGTIIFQAGVAMIRPQSGQWRQDGHNLAKFTFLKPMIFPCRTTHTRLFPSKHAFSYSYLFVGIPVEWEGSSGTLLSAGDLPPKRTWFSVHADDYLARGRYKNGLRGKLEDYLSSQGIPVDRYSYAYLVTAPRFLGFSFNPVSFWYLYDHTRALAAMILEVNNTFDERRMYLMQGEHNASVSSVGVFSNSWSKDFHVSPFNDRHGSYSLTAKDFMTHESGTKIDNNIVLRDDKGKAKVVARVYSTEPGIDPSNVLGFALWSFLARWWWVGLVTNLRILKEARVLWVKKLQVYYRPEVFRTSIGRNETTDESIMEPYFRAFLVELVNVQEGSWSVFYRPAAGPDRNSIFHLYKHGDDRNASSSEVIEINVLTPAFYTEIVRSGAMTHALAKVCFGSTDSENMLYVSNHDVLRAWLQGFTLRRRTVSAAASLSTVDQQIVSCLRAGGLSTLFSAITRNMLGRKVQHLDPSDFDLFVSQSYSCEAYKVYLRASQRMLLADRIAFGFGWLLNIIGYILCLVCLIQISRTVATEWLYRLTTGRLLSCTVCTVCFHQIRAFLTPTIT